MEKLEQKQILFFDGECSFCSNWVHFVGKRNKEIFFSSLDSNFAKSYFKNKYVEIKNLNSSVFVFKNQYYSHSEGVLKILKQCGLLWKIIALVIDLFPKKLLDYFFRLFANHRHQINVSCKRNQSNLQFRIIK